MKSLTRFEAPGWFEDSVLQILASLRIEFGFTTTAISRVLGLKYQILLVDDAHYGIQAGDIFDWDDGYCPHMAAGDGPPIAANVHLIPCYANAPVTQIFKVGAYFGFSLRYATGALFGTLFGINPQHAADSIQDKASVLTMAGHAVNALICQEQQIASMMRGIQSCKHHHGRIESPHFPTVADWNERIAFEEFQAKKLGNPIRVISLRTDIRKWEDSQRSVRSKVYEHQRVELINQSLLTIFQRTLRDNDFFARLGSDSIGVLLVGPHAVSNQLEEQLRTHIQEAGLPMEQASILYHPTGSLSSAENQARRQTISKLNQRNADFTQAA